MHQRQIVPSVKIVGDAFFSLVTLFLICILVYINDSGRILACGHEICFGTMFPLIYSGPLPIIAQQIVPSSSRMLQSRTMVYCMLAYTNKDLSITHLSASSGYGSEKENLAAEKEHENAAAKGYRPCAVLLLSFCHHSELGLPGPTCKKMNDLSGDKIFKSAAFEPSDEELSNHARSKRQEKKGRSSPGVIVKSRCSPSPFQSFEDFLMSDSDDDLPDVANMFEDRPKKRQKINMKSAPDDVSAFSVSI